MMRNTGYAAMALAMLLGCGAKLIGEPPAEQKMTLNDAITLALKKNLSVRVAAAQIGQAEGTQERQLAPLLPRVSGNSTATLQNSNLAILGVSVPGFPTVVGPFSYYDFGLSANQPVIDRQAYHNWKASQNQSQAAKLDYQDAKDLVIRETAAFYFDSEAALAEVQAAQSRVTTSQALEQLADDQHKAGLATAVDVVRAQVQLQRDQQSLLVATDAYQTSLLVLTRFLGIQPSTELELAEQLELKHVELPDLDEAIHTALEARPDYRSLQSQRQGLVEQRKASHARYFPTISVSGDYGAVGRNFGSMPGIGQIQGTVSVDLFDRDRSGEQKQLESELQRVDEQIEDLARGIEEEIRKAALDLESTEQQVRVTQSALDLAQRELQLATDRFRNGVTDNIEVITAQDSLASAQDDRITALARHADARAALARALGATEQNYRSYLAGSTNQRPGDSSSDR